MQAPGFWDDQERAAKVSAEHTRAKRKIDLWEGISADVDDLGELAEMAAEDEEMAAELEGQLDSIETRLAELEEQRLFSGEHDAGDAVVTIRSGAGGTDSQDWAEMLLRMYLRWAESRGFEVEMKEASEGEEAGLKSATFIAPRRERLRPVRRRARRPPARPDLARSTRSRAATPHSPSSTSRRWSPTTSRSSSTRPTSASTPTAPRGPAASTSTRPTPPSGSRTSRPGSSSSARTSARRPRTRRPRCRCSAPG